MAEEEIVMGATSVIRARDDDHQIHIMMDRNDHDQIMMRSMAVVIGIRVKNSLYSYQMKIELCQLFEVDVYL